MQESIQAALSVVRSRAKRLGIDGEFYQKPICTSTCRKVQLQRWPERGIGICTSIVSALTGIPVRADVAMTGEITCAGSVADWRLEGKAAGAQRGGIKWF